MTVVRLVFTYILLLFGILRVYSCEDGSVPCPQSGETLTYDVEFSTFYNAGIFEDPLCTNVSEFDSFNSGPKHELNTINDWIGASPEMVEYVCTMLPNSATCDRFRHSGHVSTQKCYPYYFFDASAVEDVFDISLPDLASWSDVMERVPIESISGVPFSVTGSQKYSCSSAVLESRTGTTTPYLVYDWQTYFDNECNSPDRTEGHASYGDMTSVGEACVPYFGFAWAYVVCSSNIIPTIEPAPAEGPPDEAPDSSDASCTIFTWLWVALMSLLHRTVETIGRVASVPLSSAYSAEPACLVVSGCGWRWRWRPSLRVVILPHHYGQIASWLYVLSKVDQRQHPEKSCQSYCASAVLRWSLVRSACRTVTACRFWGRNGPEAWARFPGAGWMAPSRGKAGLGLVHGMACHANRQTDNA
eukprot:scaffold635_cov535-Prasinococcus_capsulatus_cf.AAC.11